MKFESKTFENLKKTKQQKIIKAAMREFAEHGFRNASTNKIVKLAGISKGSLFKYFETKEKLFFYLLEIVFEKIINDLKKYTFPSDLLERIDFILEIGFDFYEKHPDLYRFIISIATEEEQEMFAKVLSRFSSDEVKTFQLMNDFYSDVDMSNLSISKEELIPALYGIITGFKLSIHSQMKKADTDVRNLRIIYKERFDVLKKILKHGVYKKSKEQNQ
ncbi:MAG: TetR/AcrR family transcriptional regulator [bacterium]|nr:TetR/AcrR family transcriptional regulator [bacterium]